MALLTVRCVTINAVNPTALAAFWAELVGSVADLEAAMGTIEELGGRLVERHWDSSGTWVVMETPKGTCSASEGVGSGLPSHPSERAGQPPEAARVRNWRQPSTSASGAVMPSWDWTERTASRVASS